jgi:hypothetical protein
VIDERHLKFQEAFAQRVNEGFLPQILSRTHLALPEGSDLKRLPTYSLGKAIQSWNIAGSFNVSAAMERARLGATTKDSGGRVSADFQTIFGKPLIVFNFNDGIITYGKPDFLMTTKGIFCHLLERKGTSYVGWDELDFVASHDLARDDATFHAARDPAMLEKCMRSRSFSWLALMVMVALVVVLAMSAPILAIICAILSPGIFFGVRAVIFQIARHDIIRRFMSNQEYNNVLYINHIEPVDIGVTPYAENIILCLKLGLTIYRLQKEKYG